MLAVVAILALVLTFAIPNGGMLQRRRLDGQARELVAGLELARQRAVMTGVKHRLWIDLDEALFRLEWFVPESSDESGQLSLRPEYDVRGSSPLPMKPPPRVAREYRPVPGREGNLQQLGDRFNFRGLDTEDGWIDRGEIAIVFDRDGTSTYAELVLEVDGGEARTLEIMPLADAVRVRHEDS